MRLNEFGIPSKDYETLWNTLKHMKERCYKENSKSYPNYGARGITICDEWLLSHKAFIRWSIENGWKRGLTIDRINVNGNYEPSNCRWITHTEQMSNKTDNVWIEHNGERMTLTQWCEKLDFNIDTALTRRSRGETDFNRLFFKGNLRDYARQIGMYNLKGELIKTYVKPRDAFEETGVSISAIHNCCKGRSNTSGGYIWKYIFEESEEEKIC